MPILRQFLSFDQPALPAAARWLIDRYARDGMANFDGVTLVVPGGRAGRRLLSLMIDECARRELAFQPPDVVTAGDLPERLYTPQRPFADELTQKLAWVGALRGIDRAALSALVPHPPEGDDFEAWLPLAELLIGLHRELSADALDFDDVGTRASAMAGVDERKRWQVLRRLQEAYLAAIDAAGLWDQQTARLIAIEHKECRCDRQLVLLFTVDMNRALRKMIDQVAEQTTEPSTKDRITVLVFAPPEWSDRFDEHGCLNPEAWQDASLSISTSQIHLAGGPDDQAEAVARAIGAYDGRYRSDEVTIGVPDARLVPHVTRQLADCGVATRWGVGRELSASAPYRLLVAIVERIERSRFADFAALVRHADVERWLGERGLGVDYLMQLDDYQARHLPARLGKHWLGPPSDHDHVRSIYTVVEQLLKPLRGAARQPSQWAEPILETLRTVYGMVELDADNPHDAMTLRGLEAIHEAALALQNVPPAIAPRIAAGAAIRWVLSGIGKENVSPPADPQAVEMLGWLDLPWDDSPALVVTSFNEGIVPEPTGADPFLPNRLRTQLGLFDAARRYARDAYFVEVLARTRQELSLLVGRHDTENDPLSPSRLLFAAPAATVAERVLRLFGEAPEPAVRQPLSGMRAIAREQSGFTVPRPAVELATPESIRVTAFRDYLACPFRFYLRHVLNLRLHDDTAEELDGAAFGNLVHEVLSAFGRSDVAGSTDAAQIEAYLHDALAKSVSRIYGNEPLAPLAVQVEQLKRRLSAPITLRGRIDRIDRRRGTDEVMIFDYKSASTVDKPDKTHRRRNGEWIDLQLPLYRHLARAISIDGRCGLGYIAVPRDTAKAMHLQAHWTDADLAAADAAASEVVRRIRRREFWPPVDGNTWGFDDLAAICQEGVFDPQWSGADGASLAGVRRIDRPEEVVGEMERVPGVTPQQNAVQTSGALPQAPKAFAQAKRGKAAT
ncbi:MAG: PD-(D/E)XK nuclease family protein [Planctomycetia bacterium]|nr:PD-(D/E)XK nuclease family protein [Planctomycetia bacterium]